MPLLSVSKILCVLTMEITAAFLSSVQLQRKASTESDTDLHFGALGGRASYKGPDKKSVEVSGKMSALDLNDLNRQAFTPTKTMCQFKSLAESLAAASWKFLGLYQDMSMFWHWS